MKSKQFLVLITASGNGKNLGLLTKYTNKTLIRIGKKPAISYIVESYPNNTKFVITLGHFGNQVKEYLNLVYPEKNFTFVKVKRFEGRGSSLGHSMLKAKKYLQEPFIYHASDTIVLDKIKLLGSNWIAGFSGKGSSSYTSFNVINNRIQTIQEKGITDPDYLHIGLVGIYDYKNFWATLKKLYKKKKYGDDLSDYHCINEMIEKGTDFNVREVFKWFDVGNLDSLQLARSKVKSSFIVLDKPEESIFLVDNKIVKYFYDSSIVKKRVKRAKLLKDVVPKITSSTTHFYSYNFIEGNLLADTANSSNFLAFLKWAKSNLWIEKNVVSEKRFISVCKNFYYKKTLKRLEEYRSNRGVNDLSSIINNERVPSYREMFNVMDWEWLAKGKQVGFHGDFILDNIVQKRNKYFLLDWRQDFEGLLKSGDMYYDLAKLNHNLILSHEIMHSKMYKIEFSKRKITIDVLRKQRLLECQDILFKFIEENNLDKHKVKILTSLVWLNMSPLHEKPLDNFLFYFGKLNLWKYINEKK